MYFSLSEKKRLLTHYGPWAIVTGASSGIGRELAERLAEAGLNVVLAARREDILQQLATDLHHRYGIEVRVAAVDLATSDGLENLLQSTQKLDIGLLVAAAGFGTSGLFVNASIEAELNMLDLNCKAVLRLTYAFAQRLAARGKGGILLFSSIVAFQGVPYAAHYAATKAYIQSLAESLAVELKPSGIDVLAAAPAPVHSGFADRANMKMGAALLPSDLGVETLKALGRKTVVFPGLLTKFLTASLATAPRWARVRIMQAVMGGFTRHQRQENQ